MKKRSSRPNRYSKSPAVSRGWKKLFAVGCSHGHLADKEAIETVLGFQERWKPDTTIHLGDFVDLSALMGMGKAADEIADNLTIDFQKGMEFLNRLYIKMSQIACRLDSDNFAILVGCVVLIGFVCMRGFGSRHNY